MADALLRLTHVSKEYRMDGVVFQALNDISLRVHKQEFVAIMGPSGSGKSTLMHIIGCLDRPTSGVMYLEEHNIFKANDAELAQVRNHHIGFVFQQFNLLRKTTAKENVELPLVYAHVAARERKRRAVETLTKVGLADKLDNYPSQLSGGQQQRVAIARALVTNPDILLADEPTGNLDSKSGIDIMNILVSLSKTGKTIILVTHDEHIAQYAHRVIKLVDGKVVGDVKRRTL